MPVTKFSREKKRKRPILAVFRFPGREAVCAWCWTMQEVADAFRAARGAS